MALVQIGWYDDGRFRSTFPSVLAAAPGTIRNPDGNYEIQVFVTNQDTNTWELSGENGGLITYRLIDDPFDTRKTAVSYNLPAGGLIILYAPAHLAPSGIRGFLTINAVENACDIAREAVRQRLIVLDVIAARILRDLDSGPVSEATRIQLRSSSRFLQGLASALRNDLGIDDGGS